MTNSSHMAHLEVREVPLGGGVRREARLRVDGQSDHICWHYDIFGGESEGVTVLDGYVHSVLFFALRLGLPLRVHGDMTDSALYNLDEFIRAWSQWRPKLYRYFEVIPDKMVAARRFPMRRAISTYSGGVDANFTLARNKTRLDCGGHDIKSVLMVHGFDVDYDNEDSFRRLVARVQPTLDEFGVDLKVIKTDSKLLNQDWEDSFGAQLSGCLHQFSGTYDTALIASSEPYTALVYPLGSTPITDRLFSGGMMSVIHDGAQFTRTEKVEFLADFPTVVDRLKVCWEGDAQHENCGVCEKCIRTRLNFMAIGMRNPSCFDDAFDNDMIDRIKVRNAFQLGELRTLLTFAKQRQITEPWVDLLTQRLRVLKYRRYAIEGLSKLKLREPVLKTFAFFQKPTRRKAASRRAPLGQAHGEPKDPLPGGGLAWPVIPQSETGLGILPTGAETPKGHLS